MADKLSDLNEFLGTGPKPQKVSPRGVDAGDDIADFLGERVTGSEQPEVAEDPGLLSGAIDFVGGVAMDAADTIAGIPGAVAGAAEFVSDVGDRAVQNSKEEIEAVKRGESIPMSMDAGLASAAGDVLVDNLVSSTSSPEEAQAILNRGAAGAGLAALPGGVLGSALRFVAGDFLGGQANVMLGLEEPQTAAENLLRARRQLVGALTLPAIAKGAKGVAKTGARFGLNRGRTLSEASQRKSIIASQNVFKGRKASAERALMRRMGQGEQKFIDMNPDKGAKNFDA